MPSINQASAHHARHGQHEEHERLCVDIVVNEQPCHVHSHTLSHTDVVRLAFPDASSVPGCTVSYSEPHSHNRGTLDEGESVHIKPGTVFVVERG